MSEPLETLDKDKQAMSYAIPLTTALTSKKSWVWAVRFQLRSNF